MNFGFREVGYMSSGSATKYWGAFLCFFILLIWNSHAAALPKWVEAPLADNSDFIFGLGSGFDLEGAKLSAQQDIASKIEVSVSSQTSMYQSSVDGQVTESFRNQAVAVVNKIPLGQLQIRKTEEYKDKFWVQLALPRKDFLTFQESQLLSEDAEITRLAKQFESASNLKRWPHIAVIREKIDGARARMAAMIALTGFDNKPYDIRYNKILSSVSQSESKTLIFIPAKGSSDEQAFANQLADLARQEGLSSTTDDSVDGRSGTLFVKSRVNSYREDDAYETRISVELNLKDVGGIAIANGELYGSGRSYESEIQAIQRAYQSAAMLIKRKGLAKTLNID